jgi:hypothetical protein
MALVFRFGDVVISAPQIGRKLGIINVQILIVIDGQKRILNSPIAEQAPVKAKG